MGPKTRRILIAALVILPMAVALYFLGSYEQDPVPPEPSTKYSLIWISLDTLRADHLGVYGYDRDTSPFIDELARNNLYFEWAVTPQNSTLPVHLTMFSGFHPHVHGIFHAKGKSTLRLADSVRTFPEIVSEHGYRNMAWADGGKMLGKFGFARGFESYDDSVLPFPVKLKRVLKDLKSVPPEQPFFYFVHTYEVHSPYLPPMPYPMRFQPTHNTVASRAMALYDGSIRYVDDSLRDFVQALEKTDRLKNTILIITSDHGESFDEYGIEHTGHGGENLHQNITRVPWIVVHPKFRDRGEISRTVGLLDFANTVLPLLGIDEQLPGGGVDVLADDVTERGYLSVSGFDAKSYYSHDYHYLRDDSAGGPSRNGIFAIRKDPLETERIDDETLGELLDERMSTRLRELEEERKLLQERLREETTLADKEIEQLRSLGYLE